MGIPRTPRNPYPGPPPSPFPELRSLAAQKRLRKHFVTVTIGIVLILQILGTLQILPWTPGLFIGGGLDRIVDYGAEIGITIALLLQFLCNLALCFYWAFMLIASSGLGADVPPKLMPGERGWQFNQRRVAYLGPLLLLLSGHIVGGFIASVGLWPLAIPFELGGHAGIAGLLYVLLIPEGRRRLVIIEDVSRGGAATRLHVTAGFYARNKGRRWLAIRHDQLRGAELNDPLWARVFDTAHLELHFVDSNWRAARQVIKCIGTKDDLAGIVSYLNGTFIARRPANYGQPFIRMETAQEPLPYDEEWATF